jgi:hypothetical protein
MEVIVFTKSYYLGHSEAVRFRLKALLIRGRLSRSAEPEVFQKLSAIADEYELLAAAFDALDNRFERAALRAS